MTSIARYSLKRFEYSGPDDFSSETSVDSGIAFAVLVANVEQAEIARIRPVLRFGLEEDAPDAPEPVELVHVGAAEERLQRRYTSWIGTPSLNTRSSSTCAKSCGTAGAYVVATNAISGRFCSSPMKRCVFCQR